MKIHQAPDIHRFLSCTRKICLYVCIHNVFPPYRACWCLARRFARHNFLTRQQSASTPARAMKLNGIMTRRAWVETECNCKEQEALKWGKHGRAASHSGWIFWRSWTHVRISGWPTFCCILGHSTGSYTSEGESRTHYGYEKYAHYPYKSHKTSTCNHLNNRHKTALTVGGKLRSKQWPCGISYFGWVYPDVWCPAGRCSIHAYNGWPFVIHECDVYVCISYMHTQ